MRNLTELSLNNRVLVWYFIIMTVIGGVYAYFNLGRMEDPAFTIRQMVVSAAWPGATAEEMQNQVTDKLEKKIQDVPYLKDLKSETRAGTTVIYVELDDNIAKSDIRPTWRDVRNFCEDVKRDLPSGVYGPYYNDRFDDVYGSVYALTGEGFSYEELRQKAEEIRQAFLAVPDVQKVILLGEQEEKVYVEIDSSKLAQLGVSPQAITNALSQQNQMTAASSLETTSDTVYLRVTGRFADVAAIKSLPISEGGRTFRLGDIAKVERRSAEPAAPKMFFDGKEAVGLAVSMTPGGNILELGENLSRTLKQAQAGLPLGLDIHQVSDQPQVVDESIREFVKTLMEAIVIVLAVSFLSLGFRTGLVVAGCIPLVLAGVFVCMYVLGIDLHKVSLGSLIIALGLLVDDAIIAVEMMSVQLERGLKRFDAACYAFQATAKPMLTGTLITCAGFIPVAFSKGLASEFCSALFPVIAMALVLSWIVSVMVAPLYGYHIIRVKVKTDADGHIDPYQNKFYGWFRKILEWFLLHRKTVLTATVLIFALSGWAMQHVKKEFFPPSIRPEIIVDLHLPNGSSLSATEAEARRLAAFLQKHREDIENYSYYVGRCAPRFVLTLNPIADTDSYGQFVIVAKDADIREKLAVAIQEELNSSFPLVQSNLRFIQTGPPADYPIMLRVSASTVKQVKELAGKVAEVISADANAYDINLDWSEESKVMRLTLDQDKIHAMGLSSQMVAQTLYMEITGATAAEFYSGDRTIDIDLRLAAESRRDLSRLQEMPLYLGSAGYVPLSQVAKISFAAEDGLIKRRDLKPTITVQANIKSGTANDATQKAYQATAKLRENLPLGASIAVDGALEKSQDSLGYLVKPVPAMVFIIMTLLMFQLRSGREMLLTLLTAPLGIIGVAWGMLLTDSALGFVAYLGILALSGMIIRNSVILIDQIQKHLAEGETPWNAVIDSAILRFRPIMLTAAAAILGMIPLMASNFWGPMAVAIASGLLVATVLTLLVLPAMYAAVYNVQKDYDGLGKEQS
ncbi:MAG: efflux RND transporter permease subunit [Selenomonadaceae bacterium]|nr:efflux RND transporter permease subunit [Selenomonadaceae bacterium]